MPTYQYECEACDHAFEILQSMLDEKLKKCPACDKNELNRLIGAGSGIIFKGSGFYETDYKRKESPKSGPAASSAEAVKPETCPMDCCGKGTAKKETKQAE